MIILIVSIGILAAIALVRAATNNGASMVSQITLQGKTFQYTSSTVSRNGVLLYQGEVTLTVLRAIASAVK